MLDELQIHPGVTFKMVPEGLIANYPGWSQDLRIPVDFVTLLCEFRRPSLVEDVVANVRQLNEESVARQAIEEFLRLGIVVRAREHLDLDLPRPWNFWGTEVWRFHKLASSVRFLDDPDEIWFEKASRLDAPRNHRPALGTSEAICLKAQSEFGLRETFEKRETSREFSGRSIPLDVLGTLISETFRVRGSEDVGYFGTVRHKSYPNSGGRHEIEVGIAVWSVDGLQPGFYWYDDVEDSLERSEAEVSRERIEILTANQGCTETCAVAVILFCNPEPIAWKYRSPRGYLDSYVNAGHASQNVLLGACELGLRAWVTTAMDMDSLARSVTAPSGYFPTLVIELGI